jgi:MFS family permease
MISNPNPKSIRKPILAGVTTNVLVLGIVSLLTDMSSEMIYPILPLFLTAIGATGVVIGLIEGAAETTASLLKVVSGWFSDRTGKRKNLVMGGYAASSFTKPFLALAAVPWHVLGIRTVERVGKGIRNAPRDALIADSTAREYHGRAFGFHKAMDSTGAVLGPILVLVILILAGVTITADPSEMTGTFRMIFLISAVPALFAVAVGYAFVRERVGEPLKRVGSFFKEINGLPRSFWLLMAVVSVFYIGEISYAFLVLRASEEGFDTVTVLLMYILFNVAFVLVAIPAGDLSDRLGRRPVIIVSFFLFILMGAVMVAADSVLLLSLGFAMYGLYKGTSEGVFKAYVTDVVSTNIRGTALGAFHTIVGLVMLPGGIIAGLFWDNVGHWATFAYGIITALAALALLLVLTRGSVGERSGRGEIPGDAS